MTFLVESIAPALDSILSKSLGRVPAAQAPLLVWPLVSGSEVARRTRAVGFQGGVLRIEVPDRVWRVELERRSPDYLQAMKKYAVRVSRIDFVLSH